MAIHSTLEYNGLNIPIRIYRERRNSVRYAITSKHVIFRVPHGISDAEYAKHKQTFSEWVYKQFQTNDRLRANFFGRSYESGSTIDVFERQYTIDVSEREGVSSHTAKVENRVIRIQLVKDSTEESRRKALKHLTSRCIAQDCTPEFTRRVLEINNIYFKKAINGISLKLNQSNWGSCSTNLNLNFSTRLLFAPAFVIDYVIIHELAHLSEMNHSDRFWKIVSDIMPDYSKAEKWLKDNGHLCAF